MIDPQLLAGGQGFRQRLWRGEGDREREGQRSQSGKIEGTDGKTARQIAALRGTDRRDSLQRSSDDCSVGHRLRLPQDGVGSARERDGEHDGSARAVEGIDWGRVGLQQSASLYSGW